ncbi:hypothetical protein Cgig2_013605 [Carnegiea gigantea]|uniref:Uncharacterized protein n=1 Tax=Carnegiea gigantea TaxID=171969 RepID=A0A9Q1QG92_9CARY|nr:hypothetical protein Cgig2_013605 [Carnegiea gigantea]
MAVGCQGKAMVGQNYLGQSNHPKTCHRHVGHFVNPTMSRKRTSTTSSSNASGLKISGLKSHNGGTTKFLHRVGNLSKPHSKSLEDLGIISILHLQSWQPESHTFGGPETQRSSINISSQHTENFILQRSTLYIESFFSICIRTLMTSTQINFLLNRGVTHTVFLFGVIRV